MNTNIASDFLLDPTITFLNVGSFGACPKPIFKNYQDWQLLLEKEPVQFIKFMGTSYLAESRQSLSQYLHCHADDVVYVPNPSYAVNMIAKSFVLQAGDEVLTTNLEYGACDKIWQYYCNKASAKYIQQSIDLPITTKEKFIENLFAGCTNRTKLIFISHITSTTALIFPVQEICDIAKQKGIPIFIDGAHAPGHVALNLETLQADMYTGACHKWMMTPKGSSFLYVKKELQHLFDPLVISWGYQSAMPSSSQFIDYHQMQGTRDFSAFLTIPAAIKYMADNDWWQVVKNAKVLTHSNANRFFTLLNTKPLAPITEEWMGQMVSIPIQTPNAWEFEKYLFEKYKITVPIMQHGNKIYLRYCIGAFNTQDHLNTLYNALQEIIKEGIWLKV
jgi:isopenicillin-N epimerase